MADVYESSTHVGAVVDLWSPLSHKAQVGDPLNPVPIGVGGYLSPSWVPLVDRRRLAAYLVLSMYLNNVARHTMGATTTTDERDANQEFGDPQLLVDRIVAATLGDSYTFIVDGADDDLDDLQLPPRPDAPKAPVDGATPADALEIRIAETRAARWEAEAAAIVDDWEQRIAEQPSLRERQADLAAWVDRSQLRARINEAEHDSTGLGDGVMVLWPQRGDWPKVQVFDPDSYFPVLPANGDAVDFPRKVHFAWEYRDLIDGRWEWFVRRLTFELAEITALRARDFGGEVGASWITSDGEPVDAPVLDPTKETLGADGVIRRVYPWHGPDDEPSRFTCLYSDATWARERIEAGDVNALSDGAATVAVDQVDLGCDFLPIIHLPNTPEGKQHYGRSVLSSVLQVFDALQENDSNIQTASRYLADPTVAMSGAAPPADGVMKPGRLYGLGENGRMYVIDLSGGVEKLSSLGDRIQDRLWQNARVPLKFLGRASVAQAASGIQVALEFAPLAQIVGVLRMSRDPKYRLLLKMAQRLAQVQNALEPGPTPVARLAFGSFLPTDKAGTVTMISQALTAKAISVDTAVSMLIAAGFPIDDARSEVERIQRDDTAAAVGVFDATGSTDLAAKRLGLEPPMPAATEPIVKLPPLPGPPAGQ